MLVDRPMRCAYALVFGQYVKVLTIGRGFGYGAFNIRKRRASIEIGHRFPQVLCFIRGGFDANRDGVVGLSSCRDEKTTVVAIGIADGTFGDVGTGVE